MIDWQRIGSRLARLAKAAPAARLVSLSLPLSGWPRISFSAAADWGFWQRPDQGLRLAGVGSAMRAMSTGQGRFAALAAAQRGLLAQWRYADEPPRAFTGFAFAPEGGAPLPNACLWVPELLLSERDGLVRLTLSCPATQVRTAPSRWRTLWDVLCRPRPDGGSMPLIARPPGLTEQSFLARGRAALAAIATGHLDKLVLTRSQRFAGRLGQPVERLIEFLSRNHPHCATFAVGSEGFSFVGASPETLLALEGTRLTVDALAGTAWQSAPHPIGDDKNRREHDLVVQAIVEALAKNCREVFVPSTPEVFELGGLSHLRRRIRARRPAGCGIYDLIARLHPTPAVGGAPTPAALDWLAHHGDTRGAWYTGGFGWFDATGDADIAVCLRCGLIEAEQVTLYAGAGFVAGSDPDQELAETEAKLATLRAALAILQERRAAA